MQILTGMFFLAIAVGMVRLFSICIRDEKRKHAIIQHYFETHPPISDEEFLELCDPEVKPEVALKVREILADFSGVEKERIYPEARIVADLGLD